jgi:hypothetical protein
VTTSQTAGGGDTAGTAGAHTPGARRTSLREVPAPSPAAPPAGAHTSAAPERPDVAAAWAGVEPPAASAGGSANNVLPAAIGQDRAAGEPGKGKPDSPAATESAGRPVMITPPAWTTSALCAQVDPELFYPDKGGPALPAQSICRRCEVLAECLEYVLATETAPRHGIWAGLTPDQRTRLARTANAHPSTDTVVEGDQAA